MPVGNQMPASGTTVRKLTTATRISVFLSVIVTGSKIYTRRPAPPRNRTTESHDISSSLASICLRRGRERQRLQFALSLALLLQQFVDHPELPRVDQHHLPDVSACRYAKNEPRSPPSTLSGPSLHLPLAQLPLIYVPSIACHHLSVR